MTKFREIVNAEYTKTRQLSAERKRLKAELNAAYAKYKTFMTEIYKPGRKAAFEAIFEAIAKAKADRKADKTAKKAAVKKTVKKAAPAAK